MAEKKRKKTAVEPVKELAKVEPTSTGIVNTGNTNEDVEQFLDHAMTVNQNPGMPSMKTKTLKEKTKDGKETTRIVLERKQWELKKEIIMPIVVRILFRTYQYQLSEDRAEWFGMKASTCEYFPGRTRPFIIKHHEHLIREVENIDEFKELYPKENLWKKEDLKRMTILYLETQRGICKMYLKPSQSVWAKEDAKGYRYDKPLDDSLGFIEKRYMKLYNVVFNLTAESYEKNGFTITYPKFTAPEEIQPVELSDKINQIIQHIYQTEQKYQDHEVRDYEFNWSPKEPWGAKSE